MGHSSEVVRENLTSVWVRKITTGLTYPGSFFRYQTINVRKFYYNFAKLSHVQTYLNRCNAEKLSSLVPSNGVEIPRDKGYVVFSGNQSCGGLVKEAMTEIKARLAKIDRDAAVKESKKPYLVSLLKPEDITPDSALFKLVTDASIVGPISRYLGCLPILTYIAVWFSPNLPNGQRGSQKFHLDHEDYHQIKGFMFLEEVTNDSGPFTLLPADESEKIQTGLNYRMMPGEKQIEDDEAYRFADRSRMQALTGPEGTIALVDTSRCFHYGSREGKSPRLLLTFQYMTPFAYVMPWNWRKNRYFPHLDKDSLTPWQKRLLGIDL